MSNSNSSLSSDAQRLLSILSNASIRAKLLAVTANPNDSENFGRLLSSKGTHVTSSRGVYVFHGAEDKILQLPIADEDRLFAYYEDMKMQLAKDSVC
jgi:hypothetical protein